MKSLFSPWRIGAFVATMVLTAASVHAQESGDLATAQRPARLVQIGALTESWGPTPAIIGLRDGLVALGYREDKDFTWELTDYAEELKRRASVGAASAK
jgi:hypothetical protein